MRQMMLCSSPVAMNPVGLNP